MSYRSAFSPHSIARTSLVWASVAVSLGGYLCCLNVVPTTQIPIPTLPSPNAYDTLLHAVPQAVSDRGEIVTMAGEALKPHSTLPVYTPTEKARFIAANAGTLATVRRALTQTYRNPPMRDGNYKAMVSLETFRELSALLVVEGQVREANGDYAGAVQSNLDAVALGVALPRGGIVVAEVAGTSDELGAERPIWHRIDHLDAGQAAAAARRLEALNDQTISFADAVQEEKWTTESMLLDKFRHESTFATWADLTGSSTQVGPDMYVDRMNPWDRFCGYATLTGYSKQSVIDHYAATMDTAIAKARLPYRRETSWEPAPTDPISNTLSPTFAHGRYYECNAEMETGLLTCTLALRAYYLTHGTYPSAISDLVGAGILTHVPADPFAGAADMPFRYRRTNDGEFQLYSVGADDIDDGGKPVDLTHDRMPNHGVMSGDDKGDWVVGVDTPPKYYVSYGASASVVLRGPKIPFGSSATRIADHAATASSPRSPSK